MKNNIRRSCLKVSWWPCGEGWVRQVPSGGWGNVWASVSFFIAGCWSFRPISRSCCHNGSGSCFLCCTITSSSPALSSAQLLVIGFLFTPISHLVYRWFAWSFPQATWCCPCWAFEIRLLLLPWMDFEGNCGCYRRVELFWLHGSLRMWLLVIRISCLWLSIWALCCSLGYWVWLCYCYSSGCSTLSSW